MIYLGTLGRMVGIKCPASQQLSAEGSPAFRTSLEGRRSAQIPFGIPRRTWANQLSDASTPREVAAVMAFINKAWGPGPFVYVSADAPVTNLLTPSVASCDPTENYRTDVVASGPMLVDGEWEPRSYTTADAVPPIIFGRVPSPVIPGSLVMGSASVLGNGAASVRLQWYDADGALLSTVTGSPAPAGQVFRARILGLVPASAHGCIVSVVGALQATRPALTWGSDLYDWADGQGCHKAIVHDASRDLIMASRGIRGGRYSNLSFTVSEVG